MNEKYCAEQINIPSELGTVVKLLTKAAIREKPADVYTWAANYFSSQCNRPASFDAETGKITQAGRESMPHSQPYNTGIRTKPVGASAQQQKPSQQKAQPQQPNAKQQPQDQDASGATDEQDDENRIVDALFDRYDPDRTNLISINNLPNLIMDLKSELGLDFTDDQMEDFVNSMQTDAKGNIDLDEFRVSFFQG